MIYSNHPISDGPNTNTDVTSLKYIDRFTDLYYIWLVPLDKAMWPPVQWLESSPAKLISCSSEKLAAEVFYRVLGFLLCEQRYLRWIRTPTWLFARYILFATIYSNPNHLIWEENRDSRMNSLESLKHQLPMSTGIIGEDLRRIHPYYNKKEKWGGWLQYNEESNPEKKCKSLMKNTLRGVA